MNYRSVAACPYCCSTDIWQPHRRTWVDRVIGLFGYERFECRKCRHVLCLKVSRQPEPAARQSGSEPSRIG